MKSVPDVNFSKMAQMAVKTPAVFAKVRVGRSIRLARSNFLRYFNCLHRI